MTFPSLLFHFLSPSKIYHMKQNYPTEKKKKGGRRRVLMVFMPQIQFGDATTSYRE